MNLYPDEAVRRELFPVCKRGVFFSHAAVTALPKCVADAVCDYTRLASETQQEFADVLRDIKETRRLCAQLIGAQADEIALLGPTSLGLSLFANGIPWEPGDEVLCYHGDYPANVYPWVELRRRGVVVRYLEPATAGEITPDLIAAALTPRTRLVALASAHFFTGTRIDIDAIGRLLHERDVLFSVDGIQTLGAFPFSVEFVDFMSADAHKWLLGPLAIGIVYVKKRHFELLRPTLLGAWNVVSPNFIAQDFVQFVPTAQRYEPGVLNTMGMYGMKAGIELILSHGLETIAGRLLELKAYLIGRLEGLGFEVIGHRSGSMAHSTTTFRHPATNSATLFKALEANQIVASLRYDAAGQDYLRFSPHFYNTEGEVDRAVEVLEKALA